MRRRVLLWLHHPPFSWPTPPFSSFRLQAHGLPTVAPTFFKSDVPPAPANLASICACARLPDGRCAKPSIECIEACDVPLRDCGAMAWDLAHNDAGGALDEDCAAYDAHCGIIGVLYEDDDVVNNGDDNGDDNDDGGR